MNPIYAAHEKSLAEWEAFRGRAMTPGLVAEMLAHSNPRSQLDALHSGMVTQAQAQALLGHPDTQVRAEALVYLNAPTPGQIADALADKSAVVRQMALSKGVSEAQAVVAYQDPQTRYEAIRTGKLPQALLDLAMADASPAVREAAEAAGGKKSLSGAFKNAIYRARCIVGI